jgi:hypothetical protein
LHFWQLFVPLGVNTWTDIAARRLRRGLLIPSANQRTTALATPLPPFSKMFSGILDTRTQDLLCPNGLALAGSLISKGENIEALVLSLAYENGEVICGARDPLV